MPLFKPIKAAQVNKSHRLARGLVGCWLFNEGTGNKVFDLSGNGNTGTFQGDTSWIAGKFGSAISLDGSGDYVEIPSSNSQKLNHGTISAWAKVGAVTAARIVTHGQNNIFWVGIRPTTNTFAARSWGNNNYADSGISANDYLNQWVHIAATYNGSKLKIYFNGQYKAEADNSAFNYGTGDYRTIIGAYGEADGGWFNGIIDDVKLYNRALSAAEIAYLYREPFCVFAVTIQPDFLFPAGQIVLLAAASTATSSAHGLLTKHSKLAGIIDAAATISATLTWHYRGPVERQWLVEALFDGMTANAFKLGTVLTGGWFWMRRSGCSALYRGPGMEQIDFANILAVAEQDAGSISPPDYIPHHNHSTYFYVVRRFNICGYQECTLTAAVKVAIDVNGNLIEPKPNNIFAWRLDQVYGNKIQLIWFYCPLEQESKPESFRIYYDSGTGHIDYENPIATINYQGRKFYTYQSDALAADRYLFAVRAEDAAGIENSSLAQLAIQLTTKSPDAVNVLNAEAV